ncbi:MAG: CheR family methyltransferase [Syntrophales bacterium]
MKPFEITLLQQFKELISSRFGLNIREKDGELLSRMLPVRMKSATIGESERYFSFLQSDTPASKQEWKELIRLLTTGESYFFRDQGHFYLLQNSILPELIKTKGNDHTLRIWSAGCSSGEEPYSVAILLDRFFPDLKGWEVFILGTDINEDSIEKARQGVYTDWSFRRMDEDVHRQYFTRNKDMWRIDDRIKRMVTFREGNLIADKLSSENAEIRNMDIIICRNVFIYFKNEEAVSGVINQCIPILNEGGYLITGHGELYGNDFPCLQKKLFPEAVIYKKISGYKKKTPELKEQTQTRDVVITRTMTEHPSVSLRKVKKSPRKAVRKGKEVVDGRSGDFDRVLSGARTYANSGDYEKAESACRMAIHINALSAEPYFLLAHIAEAKGDDEEAKNCFKKVIYLDPGCVAAYLEISGLYLKENDLPRAKKMRSTAMEHLQSLPSQATVPPYDSTAGELIKYVEYLMGVTDETAIPFDRERVRER